MSVARSVVPAVIAVLAACGGGATEARPPMAALPDQAEEAPARSVPQASKLVKDGEARLQAQDAPGAQARRRERPEDRQGRSEHRGIGARRLHEEEPEQQ